uniref:Putative thioredoxin-like protein n=1 Tax=Ixodes ricinus TaxID=34613 RepID=V5HPU6_IXORI
MALVTRTEVRQLLHPHYLVNLVLASCYLLLRLVPPFCTVLFPTGRTATLDFRETEVLTFLAVIVLFRTRKLGVARLVPYLSTACMYTKVANLLLFFLLGPPVWAFLVTSVRFLSSCSFSCCRSRRTTGPTTWSNFHASTTARGAGARPPRLLAGCLSTRSGAPPASTWRPCSPSWRPSTRWTTCASASWT